MNKSIVWSKYTWNTKIKSDESSSRVDHLYMRWIIGYSFVIAHLSDFFFFFRMEEGYMQM